MEMTECLVGVTGEAGPESIRTGLLGREILASRSPWMHEQEGSAQSLALTYELFDFSARDWADDTLGERVNALQSQGFAGVNVTHPFKQGVIPYLDDVAESARQVGAVNTVCFSNGRKVGHNTDVSGFAESMRHGLAGVAVDRVVQIGAGGAGSATAHALMSLGTSELVLVDPDGQRLAKLKDQLAAAWPGAAISTCALPPVSFAKIDGLVNATPIGMAAHPGTPLDVSALHAALWVADIVYFPLETELLRQARACGCQTLDGKGMAVFQAAAAFDLFTGLTADRHRMLESFDAFST
jgi:shikimate dehydrogenase